MKRFGCCLIIALVGITICGCSKKVENMTMSIAVSGSSAVGTYTGETSDDKAEGAGVFSGNDGFTADGQFEGGELQTGNVSNLPLSLSINGSEESGLYTGAYNNGAEGQGKFSFKKGDSEFSLEGTFAANVLKSGMINDYPVECSISDVSYNGKYTGDIKDNELTGSGEFKAKGIDYIGEFTSGKPSGKGELRKSTYVVHFKDGIDRKGTYDGETVNGLAEGEGKFSAKTADNEKYTYTGEWKKGLWHGQGEQVFEKDGVHYIGRYKNGEWNPTAFDQFNSYSYNKDGKYSICSNAAKYIRKHDKYFSKKVSKKELKKLRKASQKKPSYSKLKSNINKYAKKPIKMTITPFQALNSTFLVYDGSFNQVLYIDFLKPVKWIKEGKPCTIYAIPMDYSTYKTVNNKSQWCIRFAGILAKD